MMWLSVLFFTPQEVVKTSDDGKTVLEPDFDSEFNTDKVDLNFVDSFGLSTLWGVLLGEEWDTAKIVAKAEVDFPQLHEGGEDEPSLKGIPLELINLLEKVNLADFDAITQTWLARDGDLQAMHRTTASRYELLANLVDFAKRTQQLEGRVYLLTSP
jgi:hypothetical protein